jgi:predicted nucleic acid-binding protein
MRSPPKSTRAHASTSKNSSHADEVGRRCELIVSALIADSKTRELVVTLEPELLTPEVVHDEIGNHEALIVEESGVSMGRVRQFMGLLFQYAETVPASELYLCIGEADEAIGDTDPDDVLYVACALARNAGVWSDDSDFDEQDLVPVFTTGEVVESFETR